MVTNLGIVASRAQQQVHMLTHARCYDGNWVMNHRRRELDVVQIVNAQIHLWAAGLPSNPTQRVDRCGHGEGDSRASGMAMLRLQSRSIPSQGCACLFVVLFRAARVTLPASAQSRSALRIGGEDIVFVCHGWRIRMRISPAAR
jgi:hypothetical protein